MARRAGMAETEKKVAKADMLRAVGGQAHPQAEKHKARRKGCVDHAADAAALCARCAARVASQWR